MNYNNPYFNPYQNYPYTQQHPQYNQPQQTSYLPLTFINGIEGAKAFIVAPNQTVYLKDSDSNILYEKKADAQGRYTLTAYELKSIDLSNNSAVKTEYVTTTDLNDLKTSFEKQMYDLSNQIGKLVKTQNTEE